MALFIVVFIFAALRWAFGVAVLLVSGIVAHAIGFAHPETPLLTLLIAWTLFQLWHLIGAFARALGG